MMATVHKLTGRCCFRCGLPGHTDKTCENDPNPELGKAALERYKAWRPTGERPVAPPRNRFNDLRDWLRPLATFPMAIDPVHTTQSARGQPFSKRAMHDLEAVSGEYFVSEVAAIVEKLQQDFAEHSVDAGGGVGTNHDASSAMYRRLASALRNGEPADFSHLEELLVYTAERLRIRSRYIFALLMAGNDLEICSYARRLFLPRVNTDAGGAHVVKVLSVGGGPGPSHVAAVLLARFLRTVQPHYDEFNEQKDEVLSCIRTTRVDSVVYDLFADDWRPIIESIAGYFCGSKNCIRAAHCDLREPLESSVNNDLCEATLSADIIVFSFVLHENAMYIRVEACGQNGGNDVADAAAVSTKQDRVGGCFVGMLQTAKSGAIIICQDASHHLFPALLATAMEHGWRATMGHKIQFGPRCCCFMQKQ